MHLIVCMCIAAIRKAVGPDYPLFYDTGIRTGEDVLKAYAMGANYVFLGRPLQFAMAASGEQGLTELIDVISKETSIGLAQLGLKDIKDVSKDAISVIE